MNYSTALIIDDDPLFQIVAEEALLAAGVTTVQTADDGKLGIQCICDHPYSIDLIICDLQMPNMTGVDVVRELSNLGYTGTVIIASSEDDGLIRTVHNMALKLGIRIAGAVRKPLNMMELKHLLADQAQMVPAPALVSLSRTQIKKAISSRKIRPHYQPKINIHTNSVSGFEVLARLDNASPKASAPTAYLEAAEKHGLMTELTISIIEQALAETSSWREQFGPFKLAFNLSPTSVQDTGLPDVLINCVKSAGVDPATVTMEITEDRLLENTASTLEVLSSLRLAGFELSVDDFGTGATSIEQLQTFPFTELKIDRQFVQAAAHDEFSQMTVQTSAKLAALLGMRIVAEGVETEEALHFVKAAGAHEAQGYFFSGALSPQEVFAWVNAFQLRIPHAA